MMEQAEQQGKLAWLSELSPPERSTLVATFGGWALDGMDVMVYSFVIPSLIAAWHISTGDAGWLATAALLSSAVGGWLAGLLADRFGRVRILQLTILWFALFTFLSGFTNSFWALLLTCGLQGLGFGGEWAVGSVLMGEAIRAQHRGKAVGIVQGGWAIGWGIAQSFRLCCFPGFRQHTPGVPCSGSEFCRPYWSSISGVVYPSPRSSPRLAKRLRLWVMPRTSWRFLVPRC